MTGRRRAVALALALLLVAALIVETARAGDRQELAAARAVRAEFGTGPLAGCFLSLAWRESGYNPRATNWHDLHSDGSRGSFGLFQIGALNRRPGESVAAFAARMYDPAANAAMAHRLYLRFGLQPWGGSC